MNLLFWLVAFFYQYKIASCLQCGSGENVHAPILFSHNIWNSTECPEDVSSSCSRIEATVTYLGFVESEAIIGRCATASECILPCEEAILDALSTFHGNEPLLISDSSPTVRNCRQVCCNSENCNENAVEDILRQQSAVESIPSRTTTMVSTAIATSESTYIPTTAINPSRLVASTRDPTSHPWFGGGIREQIPEENQEVPLSCLEGHETEVTVHSLAARNWQTNNCTFQSTSCQRLEAVVSLFGNIEVSVTVGLCANASICEQSCRITLQESALTTLQANGEYFINSCESICCENNVCNSNNISAIRALKNAEDQDVAFISLRSSSSISSTSTTLSTLPIADSTVGGDQSEEAVQAAHPSTPFHCLVGFDIQSDFYTNSSWDVVECSLTKCQRIESSFRFLGNNVVGSVGMCVSENDCNDLCESIVPSIYNRVTSGLFIDVSEVYLFENCDAVCCETSNCNENTVVEINQTENGFGSTSIETMSTLATTASSEHLPSTTFPTTSIPALTCNLGLVINSDILTLNFMDIVECSFEEPTRCLFVEAEFYIYNVFPVKGLIGLCSTSTSTQTDCSHMAEEVFELFESDLEDAPYFTIRNCNRSYCSTNNCNNFAMNVSTTSTATTSAKNIASTTTFASTTSSSTIASSESTIITTLSNNTSAITTTSSTATTEIGIDTTSITSGTDSEELSSLHCITGGELQGVTEAFDFIPWNNTRCPLDQSSRCLRIESSVNVFEIYTARALIGLCASSATCERPCEELLMEVLSLSQQQEIYTASERSCYLKCCDWEDCNELAISDINRIEVEREATTIATVAQTTAATNTTTNYIWPITLVALFGLGSASLARFYIK